MLHVDIDGKNNILAIFGGLVDLGAAGNRHAVCALLQHELARLALQNAVVIQLKTGLAVAVNVDQAKNLARGAAIRVHAFHVVKEINAVEAEVFYLFAFVLVDLALHVCERGVFGRKGAFIDGRVAAEHADELLGRAFHVGDFFRIAIDGRRLHVGGEHFAIAVVNRTATRRELDRHRARIGSLGAVIVGKNNLKLNETSYEQQKDDSEKDQEHPKAI